MQKVPAELKHSVVRTIRKCGGIVRGWVRPPKREALSDLPRWLLDLLEEGGQHWADSWRRDVDVGFVFFELAQAKEGPSGLLYVAGAPCWDCDHIFGIVKGQEKWWPGPYLHSAPPGCVVVAAEGQQIYMRLLQRDSDGAKAANWPPVDGESAAEIAAVVPRFLCFRGGCLGGLLEGKDETPVRVLTELAGHTLYRL